LLERNRFYNLKVGVPDQLKKSTFFIALDVEGAIFFALVDTPHRGVQSCVQHVELPNSCLGLFSQPETLTIAGTRLQRPIFSAALDELILRDFFLFFAL